MEKLHCQNFLFTLLFLIHCLSNLIFTSGYTLPDKYFINCGSSSNATVDGRNFLRDVNLGLSDFLVGASSAVEDDNPAAGAYPLYQTARIFTEHSWYVFQTTQNGTYVVRLHFYPFSSTKNLAKAAFNVSASGFSLLSNFGVNSSNSYVIKEFFVPVKVGNFTIYFTPQKSSFAFVNAIEAFPLPDNFMQDAVYYFTPTAQGNIGVYQGLLSKALHIIHRINVGGQTITANNDTLRRSWKPDDDYIFLPDSAKNRIYGGTLLYGTELGSDNYTAPENVYATAKELNINHSRSSNFSNATWGFEVNKNSTFYVRLHFCDIVSQSLNVLVFSISFYNQFSDKINASITGKLAAPFYYHYMVDSDDSGYMNLSIGALQESLNQTAFLNGVEIMELSKRYVEFPVPSEPKKNHTLVIVGSVVGGVALVFILLGLVLCSLKCRGAEPDERVDWFVPLSGWKSFTWSSDRASDNSISGLKLGLRIPFSEILYATKRFNKKLMIGEGGFGKVYRGTLRDGKKVAVKRCQPGQAQGLLEFQTEILVLTKIRHRHLVSLIGYCTEGREMILVYEFMEKGTLRSFLYSSNEDCTESSPRSELSWEQRLEICIGAAWGLDYLHTGSERAIIHRDVKSTNILLDEDFVAKVADFGLSKSGTLDQAPISTNVKGSFGYLDPEYFNCNLLTEKSDVYSFGVVLLEVLCARPPINSSLPRQEINLADWGLSWLKKGQIEIIVDPFLVGKINAASLRKFGEIVEKCLKESGTERPTMSQVLWDLRYALNLQQATMQREGMGDSITDASLELPLPSAVFLPSHNLVIQEEDDLIESDDASEPTATEVFSQLKVDGAR